MSVRNEIDRIQQNIANTYTVLSALGAETPAEATSDNLATTAGNVKVVRYDAQTLTDAQKAQARTNIGAASSASVPTKTSQLTNDSGFLTSHQDISGKLDKSGGTMTGALTLSGNPTSNLHAATKQYVDANKGGSGTITGVSANGTSVATSGVANIPAASTSAYGVTKLSTATNSTSTSLAATASAVKSAYDLANAAMPKSGGTFTGKAVAQNNTNYTTKQVRNIFLVADGASLPSGANGDICLVYTP